jgi:hypothetical protein
LCLSSYAEQPLPSGEPEEVIEEVMPKISLKIPLDRSLFLFFP